MKAAAPPSEKSRLRLSLVVTAIALVVTALVCFGLGRFSVALPDVVKVLLSPAFPDALAGVDERTVSVVRDIRLPRIIAALLVGAALAVSGATFQGVFKNPLVSPDLLGVSAGACVGASLAILLHLGTLAIQIAAFAFGIIAVLIATAIPRILKNPSNLMLVLAGIVVGGFMASLQGIVKYVADPEEELATIVYWTMGSFASVKVESLPAIGTVILLGLVVLFAYRWRINLLSLGQREALTLGVNVKRGRTLCILCSTILTASAVCLCGTVGWVGLVVPHMGRIILGQDNRYLIPGSALLGALFMVLVDTLARNISAAEIPLSIITGLLGAPLFFWLLARQKANIT